MSGIYDTLDGLIQQTRSLVSVMDDEEFTQSLLQSLPQLQASLHEIYKSFEPKANEGDRGSEHWNQPRWKEGDEVVDVSSLRDQNEETMWTTERHTFMGRLLHARYMTGTLDDGQERDLGPLTSSMTYSVDKLCRMVEAFRRASSESA